MPLRTVPSLQPSKSAGESEPTARRIVQQIVLSILLVLAVATPTGHSIRTIIVAKPSDTAQRQVRVQARMNRLRSRLPVQGTVGYVTYGAMYQHSEADYRYRMAQHHLAPLKLDAVQPHRHALVIGDFRRNKMARKYLRKNDLTARRFFGDGLVLIEGQGR